MAKARSASSPGDQRPRRPAISPDARMSQLVALAVDCAEQQLRDGTASSQVITHFLKYATKEKELEIQILERNKELITAKTEQIKAQREEDVDYKEVIRAIKGYQGRSDPDEDQDVF
jgi:hypothetical protein